MVTSVPQIDLSKDSAQLNISDQKLPKPKSLENAYRAIVDQEEYRRNSAGDKVYSNWKQNNFTWTLEDYMVPGFSRKYIDAWFRLRARQIDTVLTTIAADHPCFANILRLLYENDEQKPRTLRVVDIAGGPGCAAFGVGAFLAAHDFQFSALVLDPTPVWKAACEALHFEFDSKKSFNLASMAKQCGDADIVVISHAHVDFVNFSGRCRNYLHTLVDSVAKRRATVGTLVVWLDRFCDVDASKLVKGKKEPKWSLTWVSKCLFLFSQDKQDRKETCLVGWISGPQENTSEHCPPCKYRTPDYTPVTVTDDNEMFHVSKAAFKKPGMKYHSDRKCSGFSITKEKTVMRAVDAQKYRLEPCKICARGSENCSNELKLKFCDDQFPKSWKQIEKETVATDRRKQKKGKVGDVNNKNSKIL